MFGVKRSKRNISIFIIKCNSLKITNKDLTSMGNIGRRRFILHGHTLKLGAVGSFVSYNIPLEGSRSAITWCRVQPNWSLQPWRWANSTGCWARGLQQLFEIPCQLMPPRHIGDAQSRDLYTRCYQDCQPVLVETLWSGPALVWGIEHKCTIYRAAIYSLYN